MGQGQGTADERRMAHVRRGARLPLEDMAPPILSAGWRRGAQDGGPLPHGPGQHGGGVSFMVDFCRNAAWLRRAFDYT